jgi:cobalt-zinc-cadmium efflux system outer membrane protein
MRLSLALLLLPLPLAAEVDVHPHLGEPIVLPEALSVPALESEARASNPALQAARARWEEAKARTPQAAAWEDPRAAIAFGHDLTTPQNDTSVQWSLSQEVPWPGTTGRRTSAAEAEAAALLAEYRQTECELEARLRAGLARLAEAGAELDLNRRNQTLLRRLVDAAQARYESGLGNEADVLLAQAEAAKNEEMRSDWARSHADAQAEIDTLLDRPPTAPLGRPAPLELPAAEPSLEGLQALAAAHSPLLAAAASRRSAAETRVELAELARRPRMELSVDARQFNGPGPAFQAYGAGMSFSLPWAHGARTRAAVAEARRGAEAEAASLRAMAAETAAHVREEWQDFVTSRHHAELYATRLLPLARRATEASRIAYEASRGPFSDVLLSLRAEQETEAAHLDHLAECQLALAALLPLTGGALPAAAPPPSP